MSITNLDDLKRMRNSSAIQQRLEWLESRIFWIGELKRKDLIDNFGISIQQATSDIRLYQSIAPDNLKYDGNVKRYLKTESAIPIFNQSPEKWLSVSHQESKPSFSNFFFLNLIDDFDSINSNNSVPNIVSLSSVSVINPFLINVLYKTLIFTFSLHNSEIS